jgi:rhamnulose-1-phosphate aldolase
MLEEPYPELDDLLEMMGEAGHRLSESEATEGAAGNLSICLQNSAAVFLLSKLYTCPSPFPSWQAPLFWSRVPDDGCAK